MKSSTVDRALDRIAARWARRREKFWSEMSALREQQEQLQRQVSAVDRAVSKLHFDDLVLLEILSEDEAYALQDHIDQLDKETRKEVLYALEERMSDYGRD